MTFGEDCLRGHQSSLRFSLCLRGRGVPALPCPGVCLQRAGEAAGQGGSAFDRCVSSRQRGSSGCHHRRIEPCTFPSSRKRGCKTGDRSLRCLAQSMRGLHLLRTATLHSARTACLLGPPGWRGGDEGGRCPPGADRPFRRYPLRWRTGRCDVK